MALQIWLPLTKNSLNYGCHSSNVTETGVTLNTNGKIGGCYSFANSAYLMGTHSFITNTTNEWSFACWMKLNATTTGQTLFSCRTSASASGITVFYYGSQWLIDDGARWQFTPRTTISANRWYHICVIRKKDVGKYLYVDGVLDSSITTTGTPTIVNTSKYAIGVCQNSASTVSGNPLNGYLNDVRFYDHALSVAEIKELAKGLCVHYKLDTPSSISNLVRNSSYNVYNNYASAGFTATITNTGRTYNSCKIYRLTYTPGSDTTKLNNVKTALYNHGIMGFHRTFLANTKYCFWILCKPISHPDTVVGGTASNISGWTEIPMKKYDDDWFIVGQCRKGNVTENKTDSIFTSFKTPSAEAGVPITIDFCCPHLVEGSDSILPEYDYIGTNPGIVDSSGYSNHGTKNGTLSLSSDTARYSMSTNFNNSGYIINSAFNLKSNAFTINLWVNPRTTSKQHFLFGSFSTWPNNGLGVYRDAGSNTRYQCVMRSDGESTYSAKTMTVTLNTWNMLTITYSGTVYTGYINGVKSFEVTYGVSGIVSHYNIMIGNSKYNNTPASENEEALVSDFRLYATCLSGDDIKRLYEVSASVSKNGAMIGYEMEEG